MKLAMVVTLVVTIVLTPLDARAQRGRSGSGGFHGGGGWQGGGGSQRRGGFNGPGTRAGSSGDHRQASRAAPVHHAGPQGAFYGHRPAYHGNWYHGDWNGHWGHPWAYRPWGWYWGGVGWGLGFGLGVATVGVATYGSPWGWGYYSYWNPYWYGPVGGVTYINYAQPVAAAPPPAATQPAPQLPGPSDGAAESSAQANALATFEMARGLFKRGDYSLALTQANRAIAVLPNDSLMHEFRGLCLFAMHDYQQSAAALYAVLSAGPGWDQATLVGLYRSPTVYQQQLRELESYRSQHPETASARFVLAYHYMLSGKNEQAVGELQRVVELEPKDQLSAQLLKGLTTPNADQPPPQSGPPPSEPVDARALAGSWQASRPDGSRFELYLGADGKFDWKYAQQDKQQHLSGTFTLADNYLILTARDQNALVGHVELAAGDKLKFKLASGSPSDPGLTFSR